MRAVLALAFSFAVVAHATETSRFSAQGTASLHIAAPAQRGGSLSLRAGFAPKSSAASTSALQSGGPFLLSGDLQARASACYSDTIFRNDFDGDGL